MTVADRYEKVFDDSVPAELGRETLRILVKHFEESRDFVESHWQGPEAHDLHGDVRRAYIEQDWRSLAGRTPGVIGTFEKTERGGSHYTVVKAGRLVMTASCVDFQNLFPRPAEFRLRNAESLQLNWLKPDIVPTADADVYGILVYGGTGRRLTFAYVGFPDASCTGWLHLVDLRNKYPDTWGELTHKPAPVEPPQPILHSQDEKA